MKRIHSPVTVFFIYLTVAGVSSVVIGGLPKVPNWSIEDNQEVYFGGSVSTAGDVNGDGYEDVLIGTVLGNRAFAYYGGADGLPEAADWIGEGECGPAKFGYCVSTAGDVNGDGYDDVIIGAPGQDRAYVYYGGPNGLSGTAFRRVVSAEPLERFGESVSTAGDVNGDGYDDVIIGAPDYAEEYRGGRVLVYYGSAGGLSSVPAWRVEYPLMGAHFGCSVSAAGDVNGDGYDDVIAGASHYCIWTDPLGMTHIEFGSGEVFVYYGSADGLSEAPDWTVESIQISGYGDRFVSAAGDVNGDGYDDILVGGWCFDETGRVFVYHGSAGGLSTEANRIVMGGTTQILGQSVASAGDVNGDGYDDVILGARTLIEGTPHHSRIYVYLGSAGGLSAAADWDADYGTVEYTFESNRVSTAGDVNNDGYSDVLIGAPYLHYLPNDAQVYAYYGSNCVLIADLTGDCHVDLDDLDALCRQWLETGTPGNCPWGEDLDGNCNINLADLAVLAREWLE